LQYEFERVGWVLEQAALGEHSFGVVDWGRILETLLEPWHPNLVRERFDFGLAVEEQDEHKLQEVRESKRSGRSGRSGRSRRGRNSYSSVADVRWCCLPLFGPLKL